MENLRKQVRRARRRLLLQSLVGKLAWCWFATLLVAVIAIGAGKIWPVGDGNTWAILCVSAALAVGALAAVGWTWLARQDALSAAVEIDRRFGLKERVSSTLALAPDELDSEIGQALARDAAHRLAKIEVGERFGVRLDRRALLPLVPAALAFLLALGVDSTSAPTPAAAASTEVAQVKKSTQMLAKKLDEKRKQAQEAGLQEADALLKELQERTQELAGKDEADRKKTLVELNDLVKNTENRRDKIAGAEQLKEQFNQLKSLQQGPADRLGEALKAGDLQKAVEEIDKLKAGLKDGKMSEDDKKALAKQIDQLKEAMEKTAQAHRQAMQELQEQVDRQRAAGNTEQADKLQQQLDKLAKQAPQMERMAEMAARLEAASKCMKQGQCDQAGDALGALGEELARMQRESDELEMLDDALAEVAECKNAMNCKECNGEGCQACQGEQEGDGGDGMDDRAGQGGSLPGTGRGSDIRTDMKNNANFFDTQVRQEIRKGAVVVEGTANGPNRKGQVQEAIQSEFANSKQETAEALTGQRLPHEYRDHAKKYFDTLRKGGR